jgi:hypothetical protein
MKGGVPKLPHSGAAGIYGENRRLAKIMDEKNPRQAEDFLCRLIQLR